MKSKNAIGKSFKEVYSASKPLFIWNYGLTLLQGLLNAIPIMALQFFFDQITRIHEVDTKGIFLALGIVVLVKTVNYAIRAITSYNYEYYDLKISKDMVNKLNSKISRWNALRFEDSENLDLIGRAYDGSRYLRRIVDTILLIALYYIPEIVVILFYLYSANAYLPLIVFVILATVFLIEKIQERFYVNIEKETALLTRKIKTYSGYLSALDYYKETKLLGLQKYFMELLHAAFDQRKTVRWKFFSKALRLDGCEKGILLAGKISIILILFLCVKQQAITIGVFAALLTSLNDVFNMMEGFINAFSEGLTEVIEKVRSFFAIVDEDPEDAIEGEPLQDDIHQIELKHVSFSYPNQTIEAIKNISLTIREGEHIAVVGKNGSGKTTLVKLLSGLYTPKTGDILYNGIPLENNRLFEKQSAVFQNYGKYAVSLEENIRLSDTNSNRMIDPIVKAVDMTGLNSQTVLSNLFGGIELSGGQWQRLAIARGFYRSCQWIYLDEPTSSIDPIEEGALFKLFHDLGKNKTSIIVTHRLGSIRFADRILVMDGGEIIGDGTHEELMLQCELYRNIWNSQARLFR